MTDAPEPIDALEAANATALAAEEDPLAMATLNAQLRSSVKGAHALIHALVHRIAPEGQTIAVARADWQAPDPSLELKIKTKPDGSVELAVVRKVNTAIRPKAKR